MQVLVCSKPHHLELSQASRPACTPGYAVVRIRRVGICGTDIHAYGGNQPYFEYPRVLGHELAGEVVEAADEQSQHLIGQNVYVIPYLHCGECRACLQGKTNCCQHMQVIGVHRDGGMAEYLAVPTSHLVVSKTLSLDQLALVECMAIGAHAVRRSQLQVDELAVVVGAGPIGMGVLQVAKSRGARTLMVDTNTSRLAFCRDVLGADAVANPLEDDVAERISQLNGGALAEVVFDATGNPRAMEAGFDLAGHGGRYVLVSIVKADIAFNDPDFHKKELTLMGSRNATPEDFACVVSLMESGAINADAMITHRAPLTDVPAKMPQWCDPANHVIKAMITIDTDEAHS
ncbi:zinc-binding alcohol dehydrogenase family protein [Halomonas sp. FME1]|uniref:Zinc-binding alcohol dehydrogenase family protein n=1 Tax=Halomonas casei TaxID=2742613 RepID=A0ABR9EY12_9GAMM|nr:MULTISPECIES: zinc-binding alcohol dehydrogenase family protein [Halomonas]MBE0399056.1 zinc-binding alcohol dehydrogenase family protein [Halomonas casei]PCC22959.1 alcohol dehydrogenase [Halomonas sp. JB37]